MPAFSNLDKILYPSSGFTKGDVLDYYLKIAPVLLPHLRCRPVTLKRYPNGVDQLFFFEKRCASHRPKWMKTIAMGTTNGTIDFCNISDARSLLWVANLAALELHVLLAKAPRLDRPTAMAFDLDPGPPATIVDCAKLALRMKDLLDGWGLQSFPKTSGGKGLHFYVPLNSAVTFAQTKEFAHALALRLERDDPAKVTATMAKSAREGRVFIDWSQNDTHKTTCCVYSLRAHAAPTVSTPVTWEEVKSATKKSRGNPLSFQAADVLKRVADLGDLFAPVLTLRQRLPKP